MTAQDLQKRIESARGQYRPGTPIDAEIDQDILVGIIDGLGGDRPDGNEAIAWNEGIRIGCDLRKALV